ncbi:MAG: sterol desaturase family protein [Parvibaculum sp.]|uniref:sterol desaturase family protein n=1 Tax=Parvibaculum sp. TaxID=2024848 RepID=UPI0027321B44|nr:sterol desaturase family protein [Parvibaculum sp.]MDP2148417.1 sterol desaturase family protein [Parvibaculum sp.]
MVTESGHSDQSTWLDRRVEQLLGDALPKGFGTGWYSGVAGVLLSVSSFLAVLVFRYPQWFTLSETASRYPVEIMRSLLSLAILAGFLFSAISIVLRPNKRLGVTGIAFCLMAILAGGSGVAVGSGEAAFRIGLDWFILNLVLLALIFVPLERLLPLKPNQGIFRAGWTTDGVYFLFSHCAVELMTFFTLLPATLIAQTLHDEFSGFDAAALPLVVQVLMIMLVADLAQYGIHRGFHSFGWAWPFHAIHHSSRAMDWLAGSRLHVVDIIVTRGVTLLPVLALGFSQQALYIWLIIIAIQATLNHVNIRFDVPLLNQVIVLPRFHHWHHAVTPVDKNFAVHFPWIDRLFGTYYMPAGEWPTETGIEGDPVPPEFTRQLVWPFRRR